MPSTLTTRAFPKMLCLSGIMSQPKLKSTYIQIARSSGLSSSNPPASQPVCQETLRYWEKYARELQNIQPECKMLRPVFFQPTSLPTSLPRNPQILGEICQRVIMNPLFGMLLLMRFVHPLRSLFQKAS